MGRHWTAEQRAKQAEAIRRWQPWESSTGPRTETGKAAAARNAQKHGMYSAQWRDERRRANELLRECRQRLEKP
jgi:hypothetical protein